MPILRASLKDLPIRKSGSITTAERESLASKNRKGKYGKKYINFRRPTLSEDWKPSNSTELNNLEYFEIGQNSGMRVGYRKVDNVNWNQVKF